MNKIFVVMMFIGQVFIFANEQRIFIIKTLVSDLKTNDEDKKQQASKFLIKLGSEAAPFVTPLTKSDSFTVRILAIEILRQMGNEARGSVTSLSARLEELLDQYWEENRLRLIGHETGLPEKYTYAQNYEKGNRREEIVRICLAIEKIDNKTTIEILKKLDSFIVKMMEDVSTVIYKFTYESILLLRNFAESDNKEIQEIAKKYIKKLLKDDVFNPHSDEYKTILKHFSYIGPSTQDQWKNIIKFIRLSDANEKNQNEESRTFSTQVLGSLFVNRKDTHTRQQVIKLLKKLSNNATFRKSAIQSLATMGVPWIEVQEIPKIKEFREFFLVSQLQGVYQSQNISNVSQKALDELAASTQKNTCEILALIYAWKGNKKQATSYAQKANAFATYKVELLLQNRTPLETTIITESCSDYELEKYYENYEEEYEEEY
ncbi:hypothetical protein [Candidatus Uabimicrobium sp. HlEnr_7]|uniref:hypothetical protein n=1 Tax=Candidatus Uabimicrobium helgolandensis TaxID=3095367 RepID=UPI003557A35B